MAIFSAKDMVRNQSVLAVDTTGVWFGDTPGILGSTNAGYTLKHTTNLTVTVGKDDKTGFLVMWGTSALIGEDSTTHPILTVSAAFTTKDSQAWMGDQGTFTLTLCGATGTARAAGKMYFVGPFESARFGRVSDSTSYAPKGDVYLTFSLSSGATGAHGRQCQVIPFNMPDVSYST